MRSGRCPILPSEGKGERSDRITSWRAQSFCATRLSVVFILKASFRNHYTCQRQGGGVDSVISTWARAFPLVSETPTCGGQARFLFAVWAVLVIF